MTQGTAIHSVVTRLKRRPQKHLWIISTGKAKFCAEGWEQEPQN